MSSYNEAFNGCGVPKITKKASKPRIFENYRPIPQSKQISKDAAKTPHSEIADSPTKIIQDNGVNFPLKNNHSWSNSRGYGNIVVGTFDSCNNVHGRVHPYNRLPKLDKKEKSLE